MDGMLPCSVGVRVMVRVLGSVICLRVTVLRVRMRTLGSACAVIKTAQETETKTRNDPGQSAS